MTELEHDVERRLAVDLFNETWTLIENPERTPEEDDEMVHCAHASAYHWVRVGTPVNWARGHWQCSRVYSILGRDEPATWHARRCLELVEANPGVMEEFDLAAAYEALARASAVAGRADDVRRYLQLGRAASTAIADDEDRAIIEADFATIRIA